MLDIYDFAYCPHYDGDGKESFDEMLEDKGILGLAMESDTAFVERNGEIYYIASNTEAKAYWLSYVNERLIKEEIKPQLVK